MISHAKSLIEFPPFAWELREFLCVFRRHIIFFSSKIIFIVIRVWFPSIFPPLNFQNILENQRSLINLIIYFPHVVFSRCFRSLATFIQRASILIRHWYYDAPSRNAQHFNYHSVRVEWIFWLCAKKRRAQPLNLRLARKMRYVNPYAKPSFRVPSVLSLAYTKQIAHSLESTLSRAQSISCTR